MKQSAGILLYRKTTVLQVLLAHPGGPFWKNKDLGAWSIPKGEIDNAESPFDAALREFEEETGFRPDGNPAELTPAKMKSGKIIYGFAIESDFDTNHFRSNQFVMEWPPRSGKFAAFPEVDRVEWFSIPDARLKIVPAQVTFLDQVTDLLTQ